MPVGVACPSCNHNFFVPDKMSGRGVKCPRCEWPFTAPSGSTKLPSGADFPAAVPGPATEQPLPAADPLMPSATLLPPAPLVPPAPPSNGNPAVAVRAPRRPVRRLTSLVMDLPVSMIRKMPGQPEGVAGLSLTALLVGLAAWALNALTQQPLIGLATGAVGLLLAAVAVAALVSRKQKGLGLPVAAALVNVQAGVFAILGGALTPAPTHEPAGVAGPSSPVEELRRSMKEPDQNARQRAALRVGELARDLAATVFELSTLLRDDSPTVRAAAAEALGQIGTPARLAFPALYEAAQGDAEESVRRRAEDALKKIGPPTGQDVIPFLEALANTKNAQARAAAAQGLAMIGPGAVLAVPRLAERMQEDNDAGVRVSAAQALWKIDRQQAGGTLKELTAGLQALDPHVRARAALALGDLRAAARDAVPELARALKDKESAEVRSKAAYALLAIGQAARSKVSELAAALKDDDVKVRLFAARALWKIDRQPTGVEALRAALKNRAEDVRLTAVIGLLEVAEQSAPKAMPAALIQSVPSLIESLSDPHARVRVYAARTLAAIGPAAKAAVPALTAALKHADPTLRAEAAFSLAKLGPDARAAVPQLHTALEDKSLEVRLYAAQALGALTADAGAAVETLTKLLTDEKDGLLRAKAAFGLGALRAKTTPAVAALNEALKDTKNAALRAAAAEALGKIGAPARITYPSLRELSGSKDEDPKIRKAAADALKQIGEPTVADVHDLKAGLANSNDNYRAAAVVALWMLQKDAKAAVAALAKRLDDPKETETVRRLVPVALAGIGPDAAAAVPSLIRALGRKDDDVLRARAAFALSEVGSGAAAAVPELHKLLADGPASVRLNAAVALWAIEKKGAVLVPALSAVIEGKEDAALRASAAELLARVAASKKSAGDEALGKALRAQGVPALRQAAADADEGVRVAATLSLGGLGVAAERALPDLMRALDDHVADVRAAALEALAKIGQAEVAANPKRVQARVAYPKLMNSARLDANDPVRLAANQTMTRVGRPGAADMGMLIAVLKDGSWPLEFRTSAAQSLALVEAENDVKPPVGDMAQILRTDSHAGIRMFVAYALADLGPKGVPAVAALGEALKVDKDAGVRRAAATALGDIGPYARAQAEPALERALTDADEGVQQAAREALKKVRAAK